MMTDNVKVTIEQVPERNRALMIATVGQVLRDPRDAGALWVDVKEVGA